MGDVNQLSERTAASSDDMEKCDLDVKYKCFLLHLLFLCKFYLRNLILTVHKKARKENKVVGKKLLCASEAYVNPFQRLP